MNVIILGHNHCSMTTIFSGRKIRVKFLPNESIWSILWMALKIQEMNADSEMSRICFKFSSAQTSNTNGKLLCILSQKQIQEISSLTLGYYIMFCPVIPCLKPARVTLLCNIYNWQRRGNLFHSNFLQTELEQSAQEQYLHCYFDVVVLKRNNSPQAEGTDVFSFSSNTTKRGRKITHNIREKNANDVTFDKTNNSNS